MSKPLTFLGLRNANAARLPLFKNKHGAPAHSKADGSDWSPAQWFEALIGELGELAQVRMNYELGLLSEEEFVLEVSKELADVQTYLDLLAQRILDVTHYTVGGKPDSAQILLLLISQIGRYANESKKFTRGDNTGEQFVKLRGSLLEEASQTLGDLRWCPAQGRHHWDVCKPNKTGVSLAAATISKFNEVSDRVGCVVRLSAEEGTPE